MNAGNRFQLLIITVLCFVLFAGRVHSGTHSSQWIKTPMSAPHIQKSSHLFLTKEQFQKKLPELQSTLRESYQKRTGNEKYNRKTGNGSRSSVGKEVYSNSGNTRSPNNDIANFLIIRDADAVAGGYGGMRDVGLGMIEIQFSTAPLTILKAYLYWNGPTNTDDPEANVSVKFNGADIYGTNIGLSDDNCWEYENSQAYRADVTEHVFSNDTVYTLENFVKEGGDININGVSLIIFYDDGNSSNNHDYVLFDGNDSNIDNDYDAEGWSVMLSGITYSSGSAVMSLHVSDGQVWEDDNVYLNGNALTDTTQVFDGTTVPSDSANAADNNGGMWDIKNFDITSDLVPGNNDLLLTTGNVDDCLSLILAVVELPVGSAPVEFGTGKISGAKYLDKNHNAQRDDDEDGIEDWTISLTGAKEAIAETDPYGNYSFINLLPGVYTVSEIQQTGWNQTAPLETTYTVTLDSGEIVDTLNFGNYPDPGTITGTKWNDADGNGFWGEEGTLSGWKFYLIGYDEVNDTIIVVDSVFTDSSGQYTFQNVPFGEYIVIEEMKDDWVQTAPIGGIGFDGYYEVGIYLPGQIVSDLNFGNTALSPSLVYDRECITFPSVTPGTTLTLPLTLINDGTGNIILYDFITSDSAFSVNNPGSSTLGTGDSVNVEVSFSPQHSGDYFAVLIVASSFSVDTLFLAGQGELPAGDVGQQIFSGLALMEGYPAPKYSVIVALTTDFQLIKASLVEVSPDEIVDDINYAISIQEGQAGIEAGDTILFGVSYGCNILFERICGFNIFNPDFPPVGGYTEHYINAREFRTVTTPLQEGYNTVSWNVYPQNRTVANVFFNQIQHGSIDIILDYVNDGITNPRYDFYIPALGEYNPFQQTDFTKGYFVKTSGEGIEPLQVWGIPVCNTHPVHVNNGFNFVSYLPQYDLPVEQALGTLLPENLNIALDWVEDDSSGGYFNFYPDGGLTTMSQGKGYFVNVNVPATLTYPELEIGAGSLTKNIRGTKPRKLLNADGLPQAIFAYGLEVTINGSIIPKGTSVKAIDVDGVVCGSSTFLADGIFALPIVADNPLTPEDEGAIKGEQVTIYIGEEKIAQRITWKEFGDTPELSGELAVLGSGTVEVVPTQYILHQNYPNPFNPTTSIKYALAHSAAVSLKIYDMLGQEVKTLVSENQDLGYYEIRWDGRNNSGIAVASGIYTYRLVANNGTENIVLIQKMLLLK